MATKTPLTTIFNALSDPTRLAVVERLTHGAAPVTTLSAPFGMAGPSFLKHLKVLEQAGVVTTRKVGRVRMVGLAPGLLDTVQDWVNRHRRLWESRLDRFGEMLAEDEPK